MSQTFRKLRLAVDLIMVTLWGLASALGLLLLIPARNWMGLIGVFICGFISFAFAVNFKRTRVSNETSTRWIGLITAMFLAVLFVTIGGVILRNLGIDIHWRGFH